MATKVSRFFVWIIMGMVLVGLIGFGSFNFGGSANAIGKVGETEIDANRYFRELRAELSAFEAQYGQNLTLEQAKLFGLDQIVLDRVIAQAAFEDETTRLGLSVGDTEIARQIQEIQAFQGVDGKFDREMYDFALQQSGLTVSEFEASLRADVARTILQGAVSNGIAVPAVYSDTLYGWARETRDFTWARVDASALGDAVGVPTDDELQTFHDDNPALFTLPETRKITYAWAAPEDMIDRVEVSDDELRKLYDERIDEFMVPERRLVERLVFGTDVEAQAAADRLASGEARFEDLVAERDLALADIDLGDVTEAGLGAAGPEVFALSEPGIIGPVETSLGPALIRMNAILNAQETSFEEARDELKGEYAADAARRLIDDLVPTLDDDLAGGATVEDLAAAHGLRLETIDWTADSDAEIAGYDSFRAAAASIAQDDYPEVVELSDGGVFAMRLDEVIAPRLQPLDEVRDQAVAAWRASETQRRVAARADEMLAEIEGGETPASLGLTEVIETAMSREAFIEGTPPALVATVFEMAPDTWQVVADEGGALLVHLDAVNAPDQNDGEARALKLSFSQQISQQLALDVQAAFAAELENRAGITLDQGVINAVNANFP
jgi:peptidyl-prolyl cis-trans isomerase D